MNENYRASSVDFESTETAKRICIILNGQVYVIRLCTTFSGL